MSEAKCPVAHGANSNKEKGFYTITSLYFDSPNDDAFNEKVDGVYYREKFRIRKYSESEIIKFESKKKNRKCNKQNI